MRDHVLHPDQEVLGPARVPVMREHADASTVRAAMDLQQRAGNRSVSELVARSRANPGSNPLATLASLGRGPAPAPVGAVASVQREPCLDCPEAARNLAMAGPETATEPGAPG